MRFRDNHRMFEADLPELGVVRIARPCSQKWSNMTGDERVRLCAACNCKVFNFAEITSEEARQLLRRNAEGDRICARIFKRFDGTVLTKDCPRGYSHGWRYARKLLPSARGAGLILVVLLAVLVGTVTLFGDNIRRLFAMSAEGGLPGIETPQVQPPPPQSHRMRAFGTDNAY
jgi:hypothetical protein